MKLPMLEYKGSLGLTASWKAQLCEFSLTQSIAESILKRG